MSFKKLKKKIPKLSETRLDIPELGGEVIVTAGTIDQQIGVSRGRISPSELISECVRAADDNSRMTPHQWSLLLTGNPEICGELLDAINQSIVDDDEDDLKNS